MGRNEEKDFHGKKLKNETHASTTDPETRLFKKSAGKELPIEVTWAGDARLVGDRANISRDVRIKYIDPDGSINEGLADRVELTLAERSGEQQRGELSFLNNKFVERITMNANEGKQIQVQSLLPGPGGTWSIDAFQQAVRADSFSAESHAGLGWAYVLAYEADREAFDDFEVVEDGLGPLYIRTACSACHGQAGKGPGSVTTIAAIAPRPA